MLGRRVGKCSAQGIQRRWRPDAHGVGGGEGYRSSRASAWRKGCCGGGDSAADTREQEQQRRVGRRREGALGTHVGHAREQAQGAGDTTAEMCCRGACYVGDSGSNNGRNNDNEGQATWGAATAE